MMTKTTGMDQTFGSKIAQNPLLETTFGSK